jgi:hypothetical protein
MMELINVSKQTVSRDELFAEDDAPAPAPKKAKKTKAAKAED